MLVNGIFIFCFRGWRSRRIGFFGQIINQLHYLEGLFELLIAVDIQNGAEPALYFSRQQRLNSRTRVYYRVIGVVLHRRRSAEYADVYIGDSQVRGDVDSGNADERQLYPGVVEVIGYRVADHVPDEMRDFLLSLLGIVVT